MASQGVDVVQITPSPEALVIKHCKNYGVYTCSEENCSFKTPNPSLLGLHKASVHKITTGGVKGQVKQYFCPAPSCHFKPESGRCFKSLDSLRTHYTKVHGEKKYKCAKCEKAFGLERECLSHEKECGQTFPCSDCTKVYNNRKALFMHCVYTGHKKPKPPEKPAAPKTKTPPQPGTTKGRNGHLVPLLPRVPPLVPVASPTANTGISILSNNTATKLFIQHRPPLTLPVALPAPLPTSTPSTPNLPCDLNNTVTVKTSLPVSTNQPTVTGSASQTELSILDKAIQSSKICPPKSRSSAIKSTSKTRKRKLNNRNQNESQQHEPKLRNTVATLTDFPRNIGSQTIFSIFQSQQKASFLNVVEDAQYKNSIYTQTCDKEPVNENHNHNFISVPNSGDHNPFYGSMSTCTDSITQTGFPGLPFEINASACNPESSEPLKQFSSFQTQTQQVFALDSATQTLLPDPDDLVTSSHLLDDLWPESDRNDVDTQTFGCFFADMMTQTLEDLASQPSTDVAGDCSGFQGILNISDGTTQTFDQMTDNDTQTFDLDISDCMTQTTFTNEIMTQTLSDFAVDTTTQTFDFPCLDDSSESLRLPHSECQADNSLVTSSNTTGVQTHFENNYNMVLEQPSADQDCSTQTLQLSEEDLALETLLSDMATQTLENDSLSRVSFLDAAGIFPPLSASFATTDFSTQTPALFYSQNQSSKLEEGEDETLKLQNEKISDVQHCVTETKNNCDHESNNWWAIEQQHDTVNQTGFGTQTDAQTSWETATQTVREDAQKMKQQFRNEHGENATQTRTEEIWEMGTQTGTDESWEMASQTGTTDDLFEMATQTTEIGTERIWEIGTQTGTHDIWEMGTQTGITDNLFQTGTQTQTGTNEIWEMGTQTGMTNDLFEIGTQTQAGTGSIWEMGTQTGTNKIWEMGTQTGTNEIWEMGTQTGKDEIWEMGTQTGTNEIWEMGTQTGTDEIWEMGTQTGTNDLFQIGTQTGTIDFLEMETQTGLDNPFEIGTQTQTGTDRVWEMGTQTGTNEIWEMGTQTGTNDLFQIGTQTGMNDLFEMETQTMMDDLLEMGTQTGTFEPWEIGTQTGMHNPFEIGTQTQTGTDRVWEMGTQTMMDDLLEMGTQTGTFEPWEIGTQTDTEESGEKGTQTQMLMDAWQTGIQRGTVGPFFKEPLALTLAASDRMLVAGTQTQADDLWEKQLDIDIKKACEMETKRICGSTLYPKNGVICETASSFDNSDNKNGKSDIQIIGGIGLQQQTTSGSDSDSQWGKTTQTEVTSLCVLGANGHLGIGELFEGNSFGVIGTQTDEQFLQELSEQQGAPLVWEETGTQTMSRLVMEGGTQTMSHLGMEGGTQTMSHLVMEGGTQTGDDLVDLLTDL